jgi:hypothetical protein
MILTEDGIPIERRGIATRANHDVEPPVKFKSHDALTISIPLHEYYNLLSRVTYSLELTYGDDKLRVHDKRQFQHL